MMSLIFVLLSGCSCLPFIFHVLIMFLLLILFLYDHDSSLHFHDFPVSTTYPHPHYIAIYTLPYPVFSQSLLYTLPHSSLTLPYTVSASHFVSKHTHVNQWTVNLRFSLGFRKGGVRLLSASPPSFFLSVHFSLFFLPVGPFFPHPHSSVCKPPSVLLHPFLLPSLPLKLGPRHLFFRTSRLSPLVWGRVAS